MWEPSEDPRLSPSVDPSADGASLTVEKAIANLQGQDLGLRMYAAWWLGRFRVRDTVVITTLMAALEDEADRTEQGGYPLRRNAARALGKLGDRRAVPALLRCLDCRDFYVREAATQSLGQLGDPDCIPCLLQLLQTGLQGESLLAEPDYSEPYDAILEALGTLGVTAAVPLMQPFLDYPVARVQCSAARALFQLTQDTLYGDRLVQALSGPDLQLRRTVLSDLGAIGYLPAAEAIANTHAENSLKLIALKGLLETQIQLSPFDRLSEGAIRVMSLMDGLL
jgi:phycocyanobilin lyase alpha subunit